MTKEEFIELASKNWDKIKSHKSDSENYLLFPNPTDGVVNIWFENELERGADIRVFNSIAQLIRN